MPYELQRYRTGAIDDDCKAMNAGADGREGGQQRPLKVRTKRLNARTESIPEPGSIQPALDLDGYPVPDPEDTKAHPEMAYELAREVIEQARILGRCANIAIATTFCR